MGGQHGDKNGKGRDTGVGDGDKHGQSRADPIMLSLFANRFVRCSRSSASVWRS
jgi:hypothetical protein